MRHHLDVPLATDTEQQVFELRRLRSELGSQALDSSNQRLYPLPSQLVEREAFIADRDAAVPDELIPSWHYRPARRKG